MHARFAGTESGSLNTEELLNTVHLIIGSHFVKGGWFLLQEKISQVLKQFPKITFQKQFSETTGS